MKRSEERCSKAFQGLLTLLWDLEHEHTRGRAAEARLVALLRRDPLGCTNHTSSLLAIAKIRTLIRASDVVSSG